MTISFANTSPTAVALSALALTDTLGSNISVAATPNAATTCTGGTVTAAAGGSSVALSGAGLAPGATCTVTVSVTGTVAGIYTKTIVANAVITAQRATNNLPAQATLTIGEPALVVTKTSDPGGASVSPSQTIAYTIVVKNTGTQTETNAHVTDTLANATLAVRSPSTAPRRPMRWSRTVTIRPARVRRIDDDRVSCEREFERANWGAGDA
jgi:uncharacterized repeat protein (TIGR01451 family)